jgi:hypothetical protein
VPGRRCRTGTNLLATGPTLAGATRPRPRVAGSQRRDGGGSGGGWGAAALAPYGASPICGGGLPLKCRERWTGESALHGAAGSYPRPGCPPTWSQAESGASPHPARRTLNPKPKRRHLPERRRAKASGDTCASDRNGGELLFLWLGHDLPRCFAWIVCATWRTPGHKKRRPRRRPRANGGTGLRPAHPARARESVPGEPHPPGRVYPWTADRRSASSISRRIEPASSESFRFGVEHLTRRIAPRTSSSSSSLKPKSLAGLFEFDHRELISHRW